MVATRYFLHHSYLHCRPRRHGRCIFSVVMCELVSYLFSVDADGQPPRS